jgi:hypothetical protein
LPEREGVVLLEDGALIEQAQRHYATSVLYQESPEVSRLLRYDGGFFFCRGSMSGRVNADGTWNEEVYLVELIPRSEWDGPTRNGTQFIKGTRKEAWDTDTHRRGVEVLCLEDGQRYVATGRTVTLRRIRGRAQESQPTQA